MTTLVALIQLSCGRDETANLAQAEAFIRQAAARGAGFVVTPENTSFLGPHALKIPTAQDLQGPTCRLMGALAAELGIWLLMGSFHERCPDPTRTYNTSVLFAPDGHIHAVYRKLHLFDVDLPDGPSFLESNTVLAGSEAVVTDTPMGRLGLSICYDLRFPTHYQHLVQQGAEILTVPSAFTRPTGRAHWELLLRARAVETQSWVLAPNQCGEHDDEGLRASWGHSMIVDPWGRVVAEAGEEPGWIMAPVDPGLVHTTRRNMPVASHQRYAPAGDPLPATQPIVSE